MTPLDEIEKTIKYVQKILKCFEDDQDNGIYKANLVILEALQVYAATFKESSVAMNKVGRHALLFYQGNTDKMFKDMIGQLIKEVMCKE